MTYDEFQNTRKYFEKKALDLMGHEGKNDAVTGVPYTHYRIFHIDGRVFYCAQINTFKVILEDHINHAQAANPELFGTGDAMDVVEALKRVSGTSFFEAAQFVDFLSHEKCAYVFEGENGVVKDRMLRLDLFRKISMGKDGKPEFVGGLLHAFKHFSIQGINCSTGKSGHNLSHPLELVQETVDAFFGGTGTFESENKYVVFKPYDDKNMLKFIFHKEENTGVFFIDTIYKVSKKKAKKAQQKTDVQVSDTTKLK